MNRYAVYVTVTAVVELSGEDIPEGTTPWDAAVEALKAGRIPSYVFDSSKAEVVDVQQVPVFDGYVYSRA